jgi:hypothetical protein
MAAEALPAAGGGSPPPSRLHLVLLDGGDDRDPALVALLPMLDAISTLALGELERALQPHATWKQRGSELG